MTRSICVFLLACTATDAGAALRPTRDGIAGYLEVSVLTTEGWRVADAFAPDRLYSPREVRLPHALPRGEVKVRLRYQGTTTVHVDSVLLGGLAPGLRKLERDDFDVLEVGARPLTLTFDDPADRLLTITARQAPAQLTDQAFKFPAANLFKPISRDSSFYSYRLGSRRRAPLFKVFSRTGTGHPSTHTYGWVRDDGRRLYVTIDFAPDNTFDGEADYAEVYVATRAGVRRFRASVSDQRWGRPSFTYTPRAAYQHKVYDFAIPLAAAGLRAGETARLAFAAYGTSAPDLGPDTGPDQAVPDQQVADQQAADTQTPDAPVPDTKSSVDVTPGKQDAGKEEDKETGCDCAVGPGLSSWPLWVVAAALWLLRRRRS